jgi:hypothetical protein
MPRVPVPDDDAAKALFYSDRTCCVCRAPKKPLQIHHIDDDNSNNVLENLAVLCLDCHTETQIKGGFARRLDAAQVRLYRDEWLDKIGRSARGRRADTGRDSPSAPFTVEAEAGDSAQKHERVELRLMEMEETERLTDLALDYHHSGRFALRDKYIEKALLNKDVPVEDQLFFRSLQGKVHLVDAAQIKRQFDEWKTGKNWSSLARACLHLGRHDEAVEYYCLTGIEGLKEGNPFLAGFYIKEMIDGKLVAYLFERALHQAKEKNDVWWQIRSLQELGRDDEIDGLVLQNRKLIESRGREHELMYLKSALRSKQAKKRKTSDAPTD